MTPVSKPVLTVATQDAEYALNAMLDIWVEDKLVDPRLAAVARTQFELGFMALRKAVWKAGRPA